MYHWGAVPAENASGAHLTADINDCCTGSILELMFEIERGSNEIVPGALWALTAQFGSRGDEEISIHVTQDGPVGTKQ